MNKTVSVSLAILVSAGLSSCSVVKTTAKATYSAGSMAAGVVTAPFRADNNEFPDRLSPEEAFRQGRVKNSPYVIDGQSYVPMSVAEARNFSETGIASWYGHETRNKPDGHITANGESFHPDMISAAHKYLPLPINVKVTNLENRQSLIVRVNDRGPFAHDRVIDLSEAAAKKLGFHEKGTAPVKIEVVTMQADAYP
ncbi:septal ring lytic transglycosylase RlpA family protein [Prosthecochloris sp. HL-130-GSB]|jgi:rare lipoprotein A|uniref:septal ring lytic transglycosylase RlpA family protein n=1 Tax=Prosthecochloris sp. HL-130-GSB TaxID=1974213 RepID=UPI000A1C0EBA|nr:septal ring lytic transglycosylase RlpA family protein [Prosthecochloris sp. HL-130-GSB]ARM31719.1 septal ring lytic transglycosylase RlpA family lipoprotein [Prosthecochloris sp. HL-130-GSB]MBO8093028.1 septal ring lytic transglycosylase RlpA family protein [Prosthecochloris sp.]